MLGSTSLTLLTCILHVRARQSTAGLVDGFLSEDLLPSTILIDASYANSSIGNTSRGRWDDAFQTMNYHRNMMNEYLCRSFVAEQIVEKMTPSRVERRAGNPPPAEPRPMLMDEGSSQYKNWLSRTTTLDDIYRHYDLDSEATDNDEEADTHVPAGHVPSPTEYDGEVTGYATAGAAGAGGGGSGGKVGGSSYGHSSSGYGGGSTYFPSSHGSDPWDKGEKSMKLKDLFELALTALAFLSFGLFVLNLIMTCFITPATTATTTTMMTTAAGAAGPLTAGRRRRAVSSPYVDVETLNNMARHVLENMDAFQTLHKDGGECIKLTLCKNNRYSRTLRGTAKIWMPVWSLGATWAAARLSATSASMLDFLQASFLGLGGSACEQLYPKCTSNSVLDVKETRAKRRKRSNHGDTGRR